MRLGESLRWVSELPYESRFEDLQKHVPEEWIDEALEASGVATMRRRRLPAEQVVWLVLAMSAFHDLPIERVAILAGDTGTSVPRTSGGRESLGTRALALASAWERQMSRHHWAAWTGKAGEGSSWARLAGWSLHWRR